MALNVSATGTNVSQDIASNTSYITGTITIQTTGTYYNNAGTAYYQINGGAKQYFNIGKSTTKTFNYTLGPYTHNSDGSLAAQTVSIYVRLLSDTTKTVTVSVPMQTIPRATEINSISGSSLDGEVVLNLSKKNSAFTHQYFYNYNNTWYSVSPSRIDGANYYFKFTAASFAGGKLLGTASSASICFLVRTFNGSTQVGSDKTSGWVALSLPSSYVPTISAVSYSEAVSGISTKFGFFVQNQSKLKVSATASGVINSTISTYKITVNNETKGNNETTNALTKAGSNTISAVVVDSRARSSAAKTQTFNVVEYAQPSLTFTVERDKTTPTKVVVKYTCNIYALSQKNNKTLTLKYRQKGASAWTSVTLSLSLSSDSKYYTANTSYTLSNISGDHQYEFQIVATDYFCTVTRSTEISTSFELVSYNKSGKGMAIGKVSEKDAFEIGMTTEYKGQALLEYEVVETF